MTERFETLTEIKNANTALGHHWFEKDSMRFFSSRISPATIYHRGGRTFFISSECQEPGVTPRRWNVREALPDGRINTLGEFMVHGTRTAALKFLKSEIPA